MSITLIAVLIVAILIVLRIAYVLWFNSTLKQADRLMRRGNHWSEMAEMSSDRVETYHEYGKSRRAYRQAARLYLLVGRYSDAKFAVYQSIQAGKLFDKYLYM
jgi:hypothetical protein